MIKDNVLVIGAGYVGLTFAVKIANEGFNVHCSDIDKTKLKELSLGKTSIPEKNLKRDLYNDFERMYNNIGHIHIKDKNKKKQNVKITTGLVDFNKFFKIIKKKKYGKNFTFETTRGSNPIETAKNNIKFLKKSLDY